MRYIISFVTIFILFVTTINISAGTKPKDIFGWDNVRWGMNTAEVEHTLGKDVKKRKVRHDETDKMYSGLELKGIAMGETQLRASLWMSDENNKLTRMVFIPKQQPSQYEWAETFINLENYLVDKYGNPDIEKTSNDPGTSADRKWVFPSTEIELSYLKLEDSELLLLVFSEKSNPKK